MNCFRFWPKGREKYLLQKSHWFRKTSSSTWLELEAIRFSLLPLIKQFENKCIFWYTDNFATQQIIECGSNITYSLALNIFNLAFDHNIHLEVFLVGRDYNKEVNKISKTTDSNDWNTTYHLINILVQHWVKISIDRFASNIRYLKDLIQDIFARKRKA